MIKKSRCPFEIKGEADGTIIHLHLTQDRAERLALIRTTFEKFHADRNNLSMKFHLPNSVMDGVSSLQELKMKIFMYQIEIISCELEYRLYPFLPYQMNLLTKKELEHFADTMNYKMQAAYYLLRAVESSGFYVQNFEQVYIWIYSILYKFVQEGIGNPNITILDEKRERWLTIHLDYIDFYPENYPQIMGKGNDRRNLFGIVTCPLYPEDFWRYSEDVVFVLSRMKDFTDLSSEQRRKIREKCNSIYKKHGIAIDNLLEDKQPNGLWIPEMIKNQCPFKNFLFKIRKKLF